VRELAGSRGKFENWPDVNKVRSLVENCAAHGHASSNAWLYDVGCSDYLEFLKREILDGMTGRGISTCRFFKGDPGTGKTHILRLIEEIGLDRGFAVAFINLNRSVSLDQWDLVAKEVLSRMKIKRGDRDVVGIDNIIEFYRRKDPGPIGNVNVRNPSYRNAMVHLMRQDRNEANALLTHYVKGDKVSIGELRRSGIKDVKMSLSTKNAEATLFSALDLIPHIGTDGDRVPGTILLFDEADNTWQGGRKRSMYAANCARRFIDASKNGEVKSTLACFAVLNSFLGGCVDYQALHQRIHTFDDLDGKRVPWRFHSMPVALVSQLGTGAQGDPRRGFVKAMAIKCVDIIEYCGGRTEGAAKDLEDLGHDLIRASAGEEYRRGVVRGMMNLVSGRIG
jgi:hypothetical protein